MEVGTKLDFLLFQDEFSATANLQNSLLSAVQNRFASSSTPAAAASSSAAAKATASSSKKDKKR